MTLFGIITALALTTASLQAVQPTSVFALASVKTSSQVSTVNYDDLVIGSHTVKELKQMLADSKARESAPITFVALANSNEEPIYFGSMSLQQIYHQIASIPCIRSTSVDLGCYNVTSWGVPGSTSHCE